MPRRPGFLAAATALIAAGLAVRLLPVGLSPFTTKYAGSGLWGAMVFAVVGVLQPGRPLGLRLAASLAIAVATESFRLYHAPGLDAFRLTLAGRLLIGRVFSPWNVVAYALGIILAALIETAMSRRARCR